MHVGAKPWQQPEAKNATSVAKEQQEEKFIVMCELFFMGVRGTIDATKFGQSVFYVSKGN